MAKSLVPLGAQFMSTGCFCNDFREGQATIQERARERERERKRKRQRERKAPRKPLQVRDDNPMNRTMSYVCGL